MNAAGQTGMSLLEIEAQVSSVEQKLQPVAELVVMLCNSRVLGILPHLRCEGGERNSTLSRKAP